jgi:GTP cyclohydrolase I
VKRSASKPEEHVRALLQLIGDNPDREGLLETPARVVRSFEEYFSGYGQDATEHLGRTFDEVQGYDELVLVSDIDVYSHCEHHMVPFVGKAHVGYIPKGRVVGLSKLARVVDLYARRLQVQEKLTVQIAEAIETTLAPQGVAVVLQCQHFCMCYRGVKKSGSWTTTSRLRGIFLQDSGGAARVHDAARAAPQHRFWRLSLRSRGQKLGVRASLVPAVHAVLLVPRLPGRGTRRAGVPPRGGLRARAPAALG